VLFLNLYAWMVFLMAGRRLVMRIMAQQTMAS
jgi:hypothetical protein